MIKVVAFDVFNTVFDMSSIPHEDVKQYVHHTRNHRGQEWQPLMLPKSWEALQAHGDSAEGIALLRRKHAVVTCSNGPVSLLTKISRAAGIDWDMMIPLEVAKVYKPEPYAYALIAETMRVHPSEVAMVTANATFGDIEASRALGMHPFLIRDANAVPHIPTIIDLAKLLEATCER